MTHDPIDALLAHFSLSTELFFVGNACAIAQIDADDKSYLHFLRQGALTLQEKDGIRQIDAPALILCTPRHAHTLTPMGEAVLCCVRFNFGGAINPLVYSLPSAQTLALSNTDAQMMQRIFDEHQHGALGQKSATDFLCSYFVVKILRICLQNTHATQGLLLALSDKKLAPLLIQIHANLQETWNIEQMAQIALMSRAKFCAHFTQILGMPPMEYVAHLRLHRAQALLQQGLSVQAAAHRVGYAQGATLTRLFTRKLGLAPKAWLGKKD